MSDIGQLTFELLQRVHADLGDVRREQLGIAASLSAMEQHLAANQLEIARLNSDVAQIKADLALIKRRLDLVEV